MAFRTRRQKRYNKLLQSYFTRQEARAFSAIPLSAVPYMKDLIRLRKVQVKQWVKNEGVRTREQLYRKIAEWYVEKNFIKTTRHGLFKGAVQKDVWELLRFAEKEFGWRYPQYVSPFRRKRRDFIEFKGR